MFEAMKGSLTAMATKKPSAYEDHDHAHINLKTSVVVLFASFCAIGAGLLGCWSDLHPGLAILTGCGAFGSSWMLWNKVIRSR